MRSSGAEEDLLHFIFFLCNKQKVVITKDALLLKLKKRNFIELRFFAKKNYDFTEVFTVGNSTR